MNIKIPSLDNARKDAQAKMLEGYEKMGKLIEDGSVDPLYPENPAVDAAQVAAATPDKPVTVNSELLRDLLNWATSADPASIDAVVAKAEELSAAGPMGPEKLIDLTGAAGCQQPGCATTKPTTPGTEVPAVGTQTVPGMPIPAGPTGPLSPVMASFVRRGMKVDEGVFDAFKKKPVVPVAPAEKGPYEDDEVEMRKKMNAAGIKKPVQNVRTAQDASGKPIMGVDGKPKMEPFGEDDVIPNASNEYIKNVDEMGKGKNPEAAGPTPRWTAAKEDDVVASDHEVITNPEEMGKKNPGIKPDGGQDPEGMPLDNPLNKGNTGIKEDGLEVGDSEAAAIGDELEAEGGAEVGVAPGGEEIAIGGDAVEPVVGAGGPEMAPAAAPAPAAGGMVQQLSDLQARIAELEAIIKGGAAPAAPVSPVDGAMDAVAGAIGGAADSLEGGLDDVEGVEGAEGIGGTEGTDELETGEEGGEAGEAEEPEEKGDNPFAKGDSDDAGEADEGKEDAEEKDEKSEEPEEK
jgi:hypothetical protein